MKYRNNNNLKHLISALTLVTLSACSGTSDSPDEDDVIIMGTGIFLEGTATSNKLFASNSVEVRASSGERSTGTIGTMGRYSIDMTAGTGPWLIRTDLGNNDYLYSIAADTSVDTQVQNIHSYSDAVVRSWYTSRNLNIDTVFQSAGANNSMPTLTQIDAIYNILTSVVTDVIDNYGISGINLNTIPFVANGGDVDDFILQNPVIRNEDSISIVVFDPLNNTTSVAVDNFELTNDLTTADTASPSAARALRALPSASDEITLVWDVATDNVGISRYVISRNGQEVATSPYPVFVDGGLTPGMTNSYSVVAIDAAGNRSAPTAMVSAAPLANLDTIAPPAPASVLIDTRRGSLDLEWSLTDVSDVASFVISRGIGPSALSEHANVTSTFFFDEAVNAGIQYCYTISAVDASGNASAEVGPVCAIVPGETVSGDTSTIVAMPTPTPTDGLSAPQVDVSAIPCTTDFPTTRVTTDTTIPAGCYLAASDILVIEPANLTLEPGVVIKFFTNRRLTIGSGGSITAQGTASDPIVLTGLEATPGHWNGLWINSSSARNSLDHVQIEYAGNAANDWGGLHFTSLGTDRRLAMSNSTLRFNEGPGMSIDQQMPLSSFDGNRYTGNAVPVSTIANQAFVLDKRSLYTGNTLDAVIVDGDIIRTDLMFPALAVPYHIVSDLSIFDGNFNVEPGTNIKFAEGTELFMTSNGNEIVGTADAPITLSGIIETAGSWQGISLNSVDDAVLRHVVIEHAGGEDQNATIEMRNSKRMVFDNVTISNGQGVAISSQSDASISEFTNVTITGNDGIAAVNLFVAQSFNNPGNFLGNASDTVVINSALVFDEDAVLSNSQIRYEVDSINLSGSMLTLGAGVSLFMREDADILVNAGSSIVANGTAAQPIAIVGLESTPGFWNGIDYSVTAGEMNLFSHTRIADGGGQFDATAANLTLACAVGSQMTIDNSQIENSAGFGIFISANNCTVDIDAGTTFMGNALGATN